MKILWIQKESEFSREALRLCQEKGWEVSFYTSGGEGVEKAQGEEFSLIVVGSEVCDFDSCTVIKNIRSVPNRVKAPLVFVALEDLFKKVEKNDVQYFVKYPIDASQVVQLCEEIMTGKKSEKKFEMNLPKKGEVEMSVPESEEVKTLKQYISMKEKELLDMEGDLNRAKEQLAIAEKRANKIEYEYKKMVETEADLHKKIERLTQENEELRNQHVKELKSREEAIQTRSDKLILAERKFDIAQKKYEELKERVKRDIQHIRVREKELEAKLEILKRDSETLLTTKDRKLLEFKRKIDSLEYEMETLLEKERLAQKKVQFWKERISRVLRALKLGTSLLESEDTELEMESSEESQVDNPSEEAETTAQEFPKKTQKIA